MDIEQIHSALEAQRNYFKSGETRNTACRRKALMQLKDMIKTNEKRLSEALYHDLRKSPFEAYATEIGLVLNEIDCHLKHLKTWSKTRKKISPLAIFPSKSYIRREPYGLVLIMAPWNYPIGLLLTPLVGAIAAGNCVVLKPANYSSAVSGLLKELISNYFDNRHVSVFTGGREVNTALLEERYDYIFFTGGGTLGKIVAAAAAKTFTPMTLELGGKSPCIVDRDANLEKAARRIVWGKFLNAGQTCIAPDHLYVHALVKDRMIDLMKNEIKRQFGNDPQKSPDLGRIINDKAFDRVSAYLEGAKILTGGQTDKKERYIAPTLIVAPEDSRAVMQEEIFGPVLPLIEFKDIDHIMRTIQQKEKPLALYYFTSDKRKADKLLTVCASGGACINDVVIHFANDKIPFGGVGNSGMGAYHGKYSFETFSRKRSVVKSPTLFDIPIKFAPYGKKLRLLKKIF